MSVSGRGSQQGSRGTERQGGKGKWPHSHVHLGPLAEIDRFLLVRILAQTFEQQGRAAVDERLVLQDIGQGVHRVHDPAVLSMHPLVQAGEGVGLRRDVLAAPHGVEVRLRERRAVTVDPGDGGRLRARHLVRGDANQRTVSRVKLPLDHVHVALVDAPDIPEPGDGGPEGPRDGAQRVKRARVDDPEDPVRE